YPTLFRSLRRGARRGPLRPHRAGLLHPDRSRPGAVHAGLDRGPDPLAVHRPVAAADRGGGGADLHRRGHLPDRELQTAARRRRDPGSAPGPGEVGRDRGDQTARRLRRGAGDSDGPAPRRDTGGHAGQRPPGRRDVVLPGPGTPRLRRRVLERPGGRRPEPDHRGRPHPGAGDARARVRRRQRGTVRRAPGSPGAGAVRGHRRLGRRVRPRSTLELSMIKIAEVVPGAEVGGTLSRLVAQAGVEDAVGTLPPIDNLTSGGGDAPWDYLPMLRLKDRYDQAGFDLGVIEWRPPLNLAKRGLPGRDEEIAAVCTMITNMGRLGIPVWCYEWMTDRNWVRTSTSTPSRAGSVVTAFDRAAFEAGPPSPLGEIGEEQLWENLEYFLRRAVPVAED